MELKNATSNGYNAVINILHPMIWFDLKNIKIWVKWKTSKFILVRVKIL